MKIKYEDGKFRAESLALIEKCNAIIANYSNQGYDLTLRQLYYQCVTENVIPNNTRAYDNLGGLIDKARKCGLVDWNAIVDRTRYIRMPLIFDGPSDRIDRATATYAIDKWKGQMVRLEVWIEKDALGGVFERVCDRYDIPWTSCRGYMSSSEMWRAAMRHKALQRKGLHVTVLHFGDHDPSGLDMTEDIGNRLKMFGASTEIKRLALTMDQIEEHGPPPNPAKETDVRFKDYAEKYGNESWELDALSPDVLSGIVTTARDELIDTDLWAERMEEEEADKRILNLISENFNAVQEYVEGL